MNQSTLRILHALYDTLIYFPVISNISAVYTYSMSYTCFSLSQRAVLKINACCHSIQMPTVQIFLHGKEFKARFGMRIDLIFSSSNKTFLYTRNVGSFTSPTCISITSPRPTYLILYQHRMYVAPMELTSKLVQQAGCIKQQHSRISYDRK